MQPITLQVAPAPLPNGAAPGQFHIWMAQGATVTHNYQGDDAGTTFMGVPAGAYTIFAERLFAAGIPAAPPVSREYTVSEGDTIDVPVGILVGGA